MGQAHESSAIKKITGEKALITIDKQLAQGWQALYEIEVNEDFTPDMILKNLELAGETLAALNKRKRLSAKQREKLTNLTKWYGRYDIERLRNDVAGNFSARH